MLGRYLARLTDWGHRGEAGPAPDEADAAQPARRFLAHASLIEAAVWIAARLAEGLEHAHARGLLHRDLKPSNILITAEGTPMILDFNLAVGTDPADAGARARVGGTLPYMAPEQLDAFRQAGAAPANQVDERSDLYAMGLILFEMIAGRHPFADPPDGPPMGRVLDQMLADRTAGAPSPRAINPEVSWGLDSIVRKCLEPDPNRRYQSAADLAEDLRRLLDDLPLKHAPEPSLRERLEKFFRRNPGLTSSTSVSLIALAIVCCTGSAAWVVWGHWRAASARLMLDDFRRDFTRCQVLLNASPGQDGPDAEQLARGLDLANKALERFEVPQLGDAWDEGPMARALTDGARRELAEQVAELILLEARAEVLLSRGGDESAYALALVHAVNQLNLAERIDPRPPSTLFAERSAYETALGQADEATRDRRRAAARPPETARDYYLRGTSALAAGRPDRAEGELEQSIALDPRRFWSWFALGLCHFDQDRFDVAASDFAACTLLEPSSAWAYANRGLALALAGRPSEARRSYDRAVAINPDLDSTRINRALACLEIDQPAQAAADLAFVLSRSHRRDPVLLATWGEALARAGRRDEAEQRFAEALADRPDDPTILVARGFVRLMTDPTAARADFERALAVDPDCSRARLGLAHLVRHENEQAALELLDSAIAAEPSLIDAIQLRALVRGRLGLRSCLADVAQLRAAPTPHHLYNGAAALSLLSRTNPTDPGLIDEALDLLRRALDAGHSPLAGRHRPRLRPAPRSPRVPGDHQRTLSPPVGQASACRFSLMLKLKYLFFIIIK